MRNRSFNQVFDRHDRQFQMMARVFWVFFTLVLTVIVASWIFVGFGIYTVITDPDAVGTIVADGLRPVVDVIKGE